MILVAPTLKNAPDVTNVTASSPGSRSEVTRRGLAIQFQAMKPVSSGGTQNNSGRIYIVRKNGGRSKPGSIIRTLIAGETYTIEVDRSMNNLSPYRYWIDVDNIGDGAFVSMFVR